MSEFDELFDEAPEVDPEGEAAPEEAAPLPGYHQARSRRVVQVDPVAITGTPDGMGSIRTRGGSHVEEDAELTGLFEKEAPGAPPTEREYRDAVRSREDEADGGERSLIEDVLASATPNPTTQVPAQRRLGRRVSRAAEETADDPLALLYGAGEGATMGWLDELGGIMASHPSGVSRTTGRPYEALDYETARDTIREGDEQHRAQSPYAHGGGEVLGALATAPLAPEEAGLTGTGRMLQAIRTGAELGGLSAAGASEGEGSELLADTGEGILAGGATGAVVGAGGETVRGVGRTARRLAPEARASADLARVASVAPGRTISRTDPTIAEWAGDLASPTESLAAGAERLRRLRITGPVRSTRGVHDAAREAYERIGREVLGPIRARIAEGGPVPTADVTRSLLAYADQLAASPNASLRPMARMVRQQARAMAESWGERVPYAEAERLLRELGDQTQWASRAGTPVRPPTEVRQQVYRAMRSDLDDLAEQRIAPEGVEAFRAGRYDAQAARRARDQSEALLGRAAQSSGGPGLADAALASAASSMGASPMGALGVAAARRMTGGGRMASIRATGSEAIARLLESVGGSQRLGQYGPILQRALERGAPALAATHYTLSQTDPEYRALTEQLAESDGDEEADPLAQYFDDAAAPQ